MSRKILPIPRVDRITFFENHNDTWEASAGALGTSTAAVAQLAAKTSAARAAYNAHLLAQEQARAATQAYHAAVADMTADGSAIIQQVKAKAALEGNSIYTLALLPIPATPAPLPPPGTPADFKAALRTDGSLDLAWRCPNPTGSGGTTYQVSRKDGASGQFNTLMTVGTRRFNDATLPAGTPSVTYKVQALRSTAIGSPAYFIVNLGVASGARTGQSPKLAA